MALNLAAIPAGMPFLDTLATRWRAASGDVMGRGMLLLPTRRAARALADAFLRVADGTPQLLPRITAIGALDEAPLALAGALDLPPAIAPAQRLAVLSRMILALPAEQGGAGTADRAWLLAGELALLMDEAERAERDLPDALAAASGGEHAQHWDVTLRFLDIVTRAWPGWLAEQGLMNPVARQVRLLDAQSRVWQDFPPDEPVWIAGATGATPAITRLLATVVRLDRGMAVLPGLDREMGDEAWDALDETHPQSGLRTLLRDLGAVRDDVADWASAPTGRFATLSRALLPAASLPAWRQPFATNMNNLTRLSPADQQEEAAAIALVLRDALAVPGSRAALVTPDRVLAGRVATELLRFGVVADDSAGEPLADTPPAVLLRLLARAVTAGLSPVPLLALLKHPLVGLGMAPGACRNAARALERAFLRGPAPSLGLSGLRRAASAGTAQVADLLDRLEVALAPLLRSVAAVAAAPVDLLAALIESAEAMAATDDESGPSRLWALEEGEALATRLTELLDALPSLPDQPPSVLPGLLDALLDGESVRSRRALRGRDAGAEHPRLFIWGLLEARLQSVETIVLGGLVEGVWPAAADPGPWLSRPMRARAKLPSPEERVGQSAHDFVMAACAAPIAVLSCPRRRDSAPAVPARWLARLDAFLAGQHTALAPHAAAGWARLLDHPDGAPAPMAPPQPRPAVALRPRSLRVTEIQTWLEDPFAIYARHVLKLARLRPLEEATDAADYGTLVHRALQLFLREHGERWPAGAERHLRDKMDIALQQAELRPALVAWWRPRLHRIADWVCLEEIRRRAESAPSRIVAEADGTWTLDVPGGFSLRGRADRLELHDDGRISILDYKTGTVPSQTLVNAGFAPQLPLEAAMAAAGAFAGMAGDARELSYWHLTGGWQAGDARELFKNVAADIAAAVHLAETKLRELIVAFDDPARAYLSQPHPGRVPRFSDYGQLARVSEWTAAEDEE